MKFSESISCSLTENDPIIGGEGIVVQIDECKFWKGNSTEPILLKEYGYLAG